MPYKNDFTAGHTDAKEFNNLMAMTADGDVKGLILGSATVNVASLDDGAGATQSITVPGVALGDIVIGTSFGVDLVDMTVTAYVQAADTVEVRVQNESTAPVDLAETTVRVLIADVT